METRCKSNFSKLKSGDERTRVAWRLRAEEGALLEGMRDLPICWENGC